MQNNMQTIFFLVALFMAGTVVGQQHDYELNVQGAELFIQAGADVYVWGDVHIEENATGGKLENNGFIEVQGNWYSVDDNYQQSGTGTVRFENNDVNVTESQFISGDNAVRGGQSQIGVNDGSFYNLELANTQGLVYLNGAGSNTDVRSTINFSPNGSGNSPVNRLRTDATDQVNGAAYQATFGMMSNTPGLGNFLNNTITANGNTSAVDNGYIQGKLRRAIFPVGGDYGFPIGLEPNTSTAAARGVQYANMEHGFNGYDVITGYFEQGSPNVIVGTPEECNVIIDCFSGADHGEWEFTSLSSGPYSYKMTIWPQDFTSCPNSDFFITKDDAITGNLGDCGPSPVGLSRGGFQGFSSFSFASGTTPLAVELVELKAQPILNRYIKVSWTTVSEIENDRFEVQRSLDGTNFSTINMVAGAGTSNDAANYSIDDYAVLPEKLYYYRLRIVDFDGSFEFSNVVTAQLESRDYSITISPNPVKGNSILNIGSVESGKVEITIADVLGRVVSSKIVEVAPGINEIEMQTSGLSSAPYFIYVTNENEIRRVTKFIKH